MIFVQSAGAAEYPSAQTHPMYSAAPVDWARHSWSLTNRLFNVTSRTLIG